MTWAPRTFGLPSLVALAATTFLVLPACSSDDDPAETSDGAGGSSESGGSVGSGGEMVIRDDGSGGEPMGLGGMDGSGGAPTVLALPELLSETGLYDSDMTTLAAGVRPFRPQFPLWTDGAKKARWVLLPEGEQIDTSQMDYWQLPIGTKLWKEFARDGVRVETRLLERTASGLWLMMAYQWRDDQMEADAVPAGVVDASGTDHDIPSQEQCFQCHNQIPGRAIGFSAVQLAHDAGIDVAGEPAENEWTLTELQTAGVLTDPPPVIAVPGTDVERDALGYLHANCGHCHHPQSGVSARVDMQLWLPVGSLGSVGETPTFTTTVGIDSALVGEGPPGATSRIAPGDLLSSAVYARFNTTGEPYSMPPLGTEIIDPTGLAALDAWINSMAPVGP